MSVLPETDNIEVKTAEPNVFEMKHRLIWIKTSTDVPSDCVIRFRDGNKTECGYIQSLSCE